MNRISTSNKKTVSQSDGQDIMSLKPNISAAQTMNNSPSKNHKRVSRIITEDRVSMTANQSLRDKLENDIRNRQPLSKFVPDDYSSQRKSGGHNSQRKSTAKASPHQMSEVSSIQPTDMNALKQIRKSMAINAADHQQTTKSIRHSIARASVSFKIADGTESGDLVIENERLKSTLMILNQKLKVVTDLEN